MSNLELWERLARTDPRHTKQFTRAGGFRGTAIKPMWAIKRATEEWGPVGKGWGWKQGGMHIVDGAEGQKLIYVQASIWYTDNGALCETGPQWGGDFITKWIGSGDKARLVSDDEAIKKALTDAVSKCLSYLGIGADVHMGQFDDSKYVAEVTKVYKEKDDSLKEAMSKADLIETAEKYSNQIKSVKEGLALYIDPHSEGADFYGSTQEEIQSAGLKMAAEALTQIPQDALQVLKVPQCKGGPWTPAEYKVFSNPQFRETYYAAVREK